MRLLLVTVYLYDSKSAEITGDDSPVNDIPKKCAIDLDQVAAMWESFDPGIIISTRNGERFWIKDANFEEYFNKWQGTCAASNCASATTGIPYPPAVGIRTSDEGGAGKSDQINEDEHFNLTEEIRKLTGE